MQVRRQALLAAIALIAMVLVLHCQSSLILPISRLLAIVLDRRTVLAQQASRRSNVRPNPVGTILQNFCYHVTGPTQPAACVSHSHATCACCSACVSQPGTSA